MPIMRIRRYKSLTVSSIERQSSTIQRDIIKHIVDNQLRPHNKPRVPDTNDIGGHESGGQDIFNTN